MVMVTADNQPLPQIVGLIADPAAVLQRLLRTADVLTSLLVMAHRAEHAWHQASDDMDDDTLNDHPDHMSAEQLDRLRDQGSAAAGFKLAAIAATAMADDLAQGLGVTLETLETDD